MSQEENIPQMNEVESATVPVVEVPVVEVLNQAEPEAPAVSEELSLDDVFEEQEPVVPVVEEMDDTDGASPIKQTHNATMHYSVSSARSVGTPDVVVIPPAVKDVITERIHSVPNVDIVVSEKQRKWASSVKDSQDHLPMRDAYVARLAEQGADFNQHMAFGGTLYRGSAPVLSKKPGSVEMEGERALIQLVTHLGVGGLFRAPMWNSGIWVTFKPATEMEMLELNRMIYADKIDLGRYSYGLALSNTVVYTLDRVFEFALRHVYNTSVKSEEMPIHMLREHLAPQDVNSFIWGFLCANYPSGFHYSVGCINDPNKCTHVIEETLNVTKLQWIDNSQLTDWQKQHMATMTAGSRSLDSIKRYREEMKRMQNSRIILNEGTKHEIGITIKSPSVAQYIQQGHEWIGGIVESVNNALGMDESENVRNEYTNRIGKATTLCQYVHWIDSIEYGELSEDGTAPEERSRKIVTDRATILDTLKVLSATDSIRELIIDKVLDYINQSTISVIGVPAFDCPVCGKPQEDEEPVFPRHASVIPLDVLQVFFALLLQRLARIANR